jgi:hypothetical protein
VIPRHGDTVTVGDAQLTWHAVDTLKYNVNLYHFAYALGKPTSNVLFWAVTVVNAPREIADARLAIGSNAASVWWVNGKEVIGLYNDRQTVIDDGVSKRLTLKQGPNVVRGAIIKRGRSHRLLCALSGRGEQSGQGSHDESGCEPEGSESLVTPLIRNWFAKRPRFHVHFTPTCASWLSLVERWFALLTTKQLRRGVFRSVPQLTTSDSGLHRCASGESEAVRLNQDRRRDSG